MDVTEKGIDSFAQKGRPVAPEGKSIKSRYKPDNKPYPSCSDAEVVAENLEKIWLSYPEDRRRNKVACLQNIQDVLIEVTFDDLLASVRAYATESADFTRSKVCFSDNWFRDQKWQRYLEAIEIANEARTVVAAKLLMQTTVWIKSRNGMCRHLSANQVNAAISAGLIERHEALDAGALV